MVLFNLAHLSCSFICISINSFSHSILSLSNFENAIDLVIELWTFNFYGSSIQALWLWPRQVKGTNMNLNYLYSLVLSSTGIGISIGSNSSFSLELSDGKFSTLELKLLAMMRSSPSCTSRRSSSTPRSLYFSNWGCSHRALGIPKPKEFGTARSWAVWVLVVLMNQWYQCQWWGEETTINWSKKDYGSQAVGG